jgi:hypothetical protein
MHHQDKGNAQINWSDTQLIEAVLVTSSPSYVDTIKGTKMFLIPKKNSTLNCSVEWKSMIKIIKYKMIEKINSTIYI